MTNELSANAVSGVVLSERTSRCGRVTWQARRSADRGRLEVVGIVAPSALPTVIEPLMEVELRELLTGLPSEDIETWTCPECGVVNDRVRQWCRVCSRHHGIR